MRLSTLLVSALALSFAPVGAARAEPVRVAPVVFSPEFQSDLAEDYGVREGDYLSRALTRALNSELTRRGASVGEAGALAVEATIIDADPNRPTFKQLGERPGLDAVRSISLGGAELRAVLTRDGLVVGEVTHRRYDISLTDVIGAGTWSAAHRAIRQFAAKVADAYAGQSS